MPKEKTKYICENEGCNNEIPEPKFCCSNDECDSIGLPINPPFCSYDCMDEFMEKLNKNG